MQALCRTLLRLKVELVAIERPDGLLVERLLDVMVIAALALSRPPPKLPLLGVDRFLRSIAARSHGGPSGC